MSIYTITLKRERLLGNEDEGKQDHDDVRGEHDQSRGRVGAERLTSQLGEAGGQSASESKSIGRNRSQQSPSVERTSNKSFSETFSLNEAHWLDCSCGNWTPPLKAGDVDDDNKENRLVSGHKQRQVKHSDECLTKRREQLKRLEAKAREIVHSVNVTLEVTADLREPNPRIVWYKNEQQLTSSEKPVLYVANESNSNKQLSSTASKRSIKRTKSQSKRQLRSGQGYSIEETTTEIEEQQVFDNDQLAEETNKQQEDTRQLATGGGLIEKCRQVSSENGSKLTIFNLQDEDYGQYTCRLIDSIGNPVLNIETQLKEDTKSKSGSNNNNKLRQQLHLHKLLGMDEVIEVKEGDLNIELGIQILPETNEDEELMSAEEKADFIENTTINWFKDDVKLDQNDADVQRLFQFTYDQNEGFHRLIVRKATKETEGVYTCLVENESGTSSCSTQLVVGPGNKPKLTSRLQDVTVYVGQSLEFRIKSTGLPPIDSCQWFKDDELLIELASSFASDTSIKSSRNERISMSRSEETSTNSETGEREIMLIFRLCIDQLKLDDTGRYKCRINNEFGYDESDCFVKVLQEIIEEHEEVEETIEETMRLGGGKQSTEEETTTTVVEEEEEQEDRREVKRARQDDGDVEMGDGGAHRAPNFRRRLENRTIIEEEETTSQIEEELIVSTEKDENSSRSNESFSLRWFVDGHEIPRAGYTDEDGDGHGNQISYRYENFFEETSEENLHKLIVTKTTTSTRSTTRRRSSLLTSSSSSTKKSSQKQIKCQASNQFGEAETSSKLSFVRRPRFLRKLEDTETSVGETIVLKVTVTEEDSLDDLKFLRDGKVVYSSKTDGSERDFTTSSRSRIRVRNYVEIIEVEEEEETTTTTRRSSYASRRSSGALRQKKRGRTYELTIDNVQIDQQGSWECQATNEAGETSCKADVEVFAEPKIVTDLPEAVRIPPGKEIRLHVEASGSPIPVYSWFKDDIGIAEEEDRVFTETKSTRTTTSSTTTKSRRSSVTSLRNEDGINISGETLIIRGARPEDAGVYSCKIENRLGQVQSRDCKLTIIGHGDDLKGAPKIIKDFSLDQVFQVDEGESLSLKVLAEGQPKPSQHWIKNTTEEIVEETNRVEIEQTGQEYKLKIKKSRITDSGSYKVVLRNEHGETESRTVVVRVNRTTEESERRPSAPKITLDSQDKVVGLGSNVSFDVEVAGHPKPLITWYKNGRRLAETSDGRVSFVEEETITTTTVIETEEDSTDEGRKTERKEVTTIHKLIIKDVKESDEAIYSLKAENDLGSTKSSLVSLNVDKRKAATDEVTTTKTREEQAKSEQLVEEETTTTTTTTTMTKTRDEQQVEDELEEIERRKSGSKTRRLEEMEEDDDENELDEDGKKRKTTRTTRTTTTKTTTTTSEEQEEEDEETRRRRKQIEKEQQEDEEARRKSKRRTVEEVEEEVEEEEEERTKRRARTDTTTEREEVEEDEEKRRKVVSMDVDEEIEEEEEEEEIRKKKSKSQTSKEKTRTSKTRDELDEEDELMEEETIDRREERKTRPMKPRIISAPKELVAGLGSSPELEVIVEEETTTEETVVEETKVTWLKDNQPIPDRLLKDKHIEIIEEVGSTPNTKRRTLRINSLRSSDAGQYKLRVENPEGKAETSPIQVSVDRTMRPGQRPSVTAAEIVPPSEQREPEVVSVPEEVVSGIGSSPKIEAEVSGKPEPEVTWFKDGQPITPEQLRDGHLEVIEMPTDTPDTVKQALKINDLKPADAAAYHVKAENPAGEVESEPTNVRIDRSMGPNDEPVVTGLDKPDQRAPVGEPKPTPSEDSAPVAPSIVDIPKEIVAGPGGRPQIEAEVSGKPEPQLTWLKDGQPISDRDLRLGHVEIVDLPSDKPDTIKQALKINDLRPTDVADYQVRAENPEGTVESEPTKVKLDRRMSAQDKPVVKKEPSEVRPVTGDETAPKVVSMPKEVVSGLGSSPQLEAEVQGQPKPELTWLKDGQPIRDRLLSAGHIEIVDLPTDKPDTIKQALKINDLRPTDVADYQVRAENPAGTVESEPTKVKLDRRMSSFEKPEVKLADDSQPSEGQKAPSIVSIPDEVVAGRGGSPQIVAEVEGSPQPQLTWLKDGQPISDRDLRTGHVELVDLPTDQPDSVKQALKINDLRPTDVAAYSVRAENPNGQVESNPAQVKIDRSMSSNDEPVVTGLDKKPGEKAGDLAGSGPASGDKVAPSIVSVPEEVVAGRGSSPMFEAEVSGVPKPDITWFKDGQPLTEQDLKAGHIEIVKIPTDSPDTVKQALKINDMKPADAAAYHIKAENPAGEVESEPTNVRYDRSMGPSDEPVITGVEKPEKQAPAGDLKPTPSEDSAPVAPSIVDIPKEIVAGPGGRPQIEAEVSGKPEPQLTWLKDGQPISDRDLRLGHVEIVDLPSDKPDTIKQALKINDLRPTDVADYQVRAENPEGTVESEPTKVKLDRRMSAQDKPVVKDAPEEAQSADQGPQSAPKIVNMPKEVVAGLGSSPQLEAEVQGQPKPELTWLKGGQPIRDRLLSAGHIEIVYLPTDKPDTIKQALKINDLRPTDVADYQVRAENPEGTVESEPTKVKLDRRMSAQDKPVVKDAPEEAQSADQGPQSAPKIVNMPKEVVAGPGSSPQLEAEVQGLPKPDLTWLKDGIPIRERQLSSGHLEIVDLPTDKPDSIKQALKINELRSTDAAAYTLKAENPLGEVESEPANVRLDRSMGPRDEPKVEGVEKQVGEEPTSLSGTRQVPEDDQVAPSVVRIPDEVVAGPGSSPEIVAEVSGKPLPEVTWFKDGQLISDKDLHDGHLEVVDLPSSKPDTVKQALRINNLKPADVAAYHVKAENPLGDTESQPTNVRIDRSMGPQDKPQVSGLPEVGDDSVVPMETDEAVPQKAGVGKRPSLSQASECAPKIVSSPKEVIAAPGSSPKLEVEVKAQPKAKATWLKDGQPIPARLLRDGHIQLVETSTPFEGVTKQTLIVNDLRPSDVGDYTLKAENALGEVESEPIKLKTDRSMSKSDEPIVVEERRPVDESTPEGMVAPNIVSAPEEVVAGPGSSPQIETEVSGKPKPEVTWFKDGQPLTAGELRDGHLEVVDIPTDKPDTVKQALKINDFKLADVAAYHVKAENPAGEVESEPTNVRIDRSMGPRDEPVVTGLDQPDQRAPASELKRRPSSGQVGPKIISAPKEVVAGPGGHPQIEAEVSGKPEPQLTWLKDGHPVSDRDLRTGHVELIDLPTDQPDTVKQALKINDLRPSDVAEYQVRAENPAGTAESEPTKVKLDRLMSSQDEPVVKGLDEGVSEIPAAIARQRTEAPVDSDSRAPSVMSVPEEVVAGRGSSPQFEAVVSGKPKPELTWFKDGQPISEADLKSGHLELVDIPSESKPDEVHQALKINDMKPSDVAAYHVKAENPIGEAESEPINVRIDRSMSANDQPQVVGGKQPATVEAPRLPQLARNIRAPVGSNPVLDVEVTGGQPDKLEWLKDGEVVNERPDMHLELENLPDGTQKLHLNKLRPDDAGVYTVRATNAAGTAESGPINLIVDSSRRLSRAAAAVAPAEELFAPEVLNTTEEVVAGPGSHPQLEVHVRASPIATVAWYKDGKPIGDKHVAPGVGHLSQTEEKSPMAPDAIKYVLKVDRMKPTDAGSYFLVAHNPLGTAETKPISLKLDKLMEADEAPLVRQTVEDQPKESGEAYGEGDSTIPSEFAPQIISMTDEVVAGVGSSPLVEVVAKSQPAPQTTWFKDGQPIGQADFDSGKFQVVRESLPDNTIKESLSIKNLKPADIAAYHVKLENPIGEVESQPTNVRLDRSMRPNDEPQVTKTQTPFSPEEAVASASRAPTSAPVIKRIPRKIVAPLGSNPVIEVEVAGQPKPEVVWFKDGRQVSDVRGHIALVELPNGIYKLCISNLKAIDQGDFTIRAANEAGEVQSAPISLVIDSTMDRHEQPHVIDSTEAEPVAEEEQLPADGFAPQIVRLSNRQNIGQVGEQAKLEVEVKALPAANVTWLLDGEHIPTRLIEEGHVRIEETKTDDDKVVKHTLVIDSMKPSDAGQYQLEAENPFGSVKSPTLGVTLKSGDEQPQVVEAAAEPETTGADDKPKRKMRAPVIKRAPRQVVAVEGSSPVLEVEVSGEPVPKIVWFKNGKQIQRTDAHYTFDENPTEGTYKMIVNDARSDDEATYTVVATNEAGSAESAPIELKVEKKPTDSRRTSRAAGYAPQVVSQTEEVVSGAGSSPIMEITVKASPKAQVSWFRDGQPIDQTTRNKFVVKEERIDSETVKYTLQIKDLRPMDLGAFHVRAENDFGCTESEPINVRIDREMAPEDAPVATTVEGPDADEVAVGPGDSTSGRPRNIRAPQIKRMPRRLVAALGSSPVLEVEISGEPRPEIVWFKNGKRVTQTNKVSFEEQPNGIFRLCFTDIKMTDQAEYTFEATNEAGRIESGPIELIVDRSLPKSGGPFVQEETEFPEPVVTANENGPIEAPRILNLEDQEAVPGQTVKLEAEVLGNPKPDIKWLKDGDEVELNIVNEVPGSNRHSLTLKNVNDLYDGVYSIEAKNIAGTARQDAQVKIVDQLNAKPEPEVAKVKMEPVLETVKRKKSIEEPREKPFIKRGLKFSQVNQGRSIKFEVQIDGKYDELIWMKDGEQINVPFEITEDVEMTTTTDEVVVDEDDDTSTIKPSDDEDEVDGVVGAKPKRKFPPRILMRPRNVVAGPGSRVAFEVRFEGEPRPEVVWFKNGQRLQESGDGKITIEEVSEDFVRLVIEDVQTDDVAEYHVVLENPYGTERSLPVSLEIDEQMPASDDLANSSAEHPSDSYLAPGGPLKKGRAPRILRRPRAVHAPKGSRAVFEVQVAGEPEPIVNWFRDGRIISKTSDGHVMIEEYSNGCVRLVLNNITDSDVGQYHVEAENKLGSVRTIPVTLTIDETTTTTTSTDNEAYEEMTTSMDEETRRMRGGRPPRILLRPRHLAATPGGQISLEVSVVGQTKPSIIWYKDGKRITTTDERITIEKISESYERLVISNVKESDSGKYTVSAENDFGVSMSQESEVIVSKNVTVTEETTTTTTETTETFFERFVDDGTLHEGQQVGRPRRAPKFTIRPRNKKAPIGSKVDFEVKVTGEPKPDVVWYKNGRRIHTTADGRVRVEEFSDGRSKLVIEDLEEIDHGVYSAEATNEWGKERTEDVQLRVVERTEVSEHHETKMRGTAKVTTKTKKTRSHYTFSEERRTGYVTMTLTDAQMDHDGDYKLIVRNKWGEASTQAPLVVIPKVEPRSGSTRRSFSSTSDGRDSRATGGARRTPFDELEDYGHELDRSVGVFGSESRYQSGEDTYLLQLRDTEFPLRLRKYLRFGARQSPSLRSNLMDAHWGAGARVTVRERRKFREVMDEEIDDEKSGRDLRPTPMRLAKEVGTCGYAAAQLEHLRVEAAERVARKSAEGGPWDSVATATAAGIVDMMPPFFREKLKDCVVEEASSSTNQEAVFTCLAVGEPKPDYTWFRNDVIITPDANRMLINELPNGGCELRIRDPRIHDSGCFKCVARNVHGNVTCRARLRVATKPSRPEPPEYVSVTAREVFLQWRPPRDFDTNVADVLGYKLEMSQSSIGSDDNWTTLAADIGHEYYVVDDLTPGTSYSFRVSARNKFGWSDTSYSAYVTTARPADSTGGEPQQRLAVPHEMRQRQYVSEVCDLHTLRHCEDDKYPKYDYSIEQSPVSVNGKEGNNNWQQDYDLQAEITRGRFSVISKGVRSSKSSNDSSVDQQVVLKFVANSNGQQAQTKNEFDILRSLQHEKVVRLLAAYRDDEQFVFVMERLSGLDVLTYLSSFTYYNEDTVSKIIQQVMDAIEYLHFRGMCLLELLPDNVVMTNGRTTSLKLVDFSSARFVPRSGARVPINSSQMMEYCPPEVIANHEVSTASDVWCIGVLTYVLLSGFSPFKGDSGEDETRENVRLGRYKYDHLYGNCTPEVTRFLINVFKKHSSKRPTIEQLYENKWLLPNEFMIRKRQHAVFRTDKIAAFAEEFHRLRASS